MKLIEKTIALIAPHHCLICNTTGPLLCDACRLSSLPQEPDRCYRCHVSSRQSMVCTSCRKSVRLSHVWICARYEGPAKELIYKLKFQRAKAGAKDIACVMDELLPAIPPDTLICHVPTASIRVRLRGYDQSELIAKHLARKRKMRCLTLLKRYGRSRQVGSGRADRFEHLKKALQVHPRASLAGRHVLLIDDITTTGATLEAAANVLKEAGVKTVDAIVFAQPQS